MGSWAVSGFQKRGSRDSNIGLNRMDLMENKLKEKVRSAFPKASAQQIKSSKTLIEELDEGFNYAIKRVREVLWRRLREKNMVK
ncbi:unnamed protein product [Ilex paraguariensis]|uniref:Uncharacterized protein n=1 Tax=Ilex paraguariensis TaxID=185542 RepID=A0ABC8SY87_9AQUA